VVGLEIAVFFVDEGGGHGHCKGQMCEEAVALCDGIRDAGVHVCAELDGVYDFWGRVFE